MADKGKRAGPAGRPEITDVMIFLRYALPCAETLVERGWIGRDVVELELEHAAVTGERPKTDIRNVFPVAYAMCSLIAKQAGKDAIDAEVVRRYFWHRHDEVIEERHGKFKDFDKEACKVTVGRVTASSPPTVETAGGEMECENPYNVQIAPGDHVVTHYSHIIEKLTEEQARDFWEGKEDQAMPTKPSSAKVTVKVPERGVKGAAGPAPPKGRKTAESGAAAKEAEPPKEKTASKGTARASKGPKRAADAAAPAGAKTGGAMSAPARKPGWQPSEATGMILALLTACVSGVAVFANKVFVTGMDPALFTAVRAMVIGIIFLLLSFAAGDFRQRRTRVPWGWIFLIGIIGGGLAFLLFFSGLKLTTAGRAAFLHKTLPLWTAVLAVVFLKERVGKKQATAMLIMTAGAVALLSAGIQASDMWADPSLGDALVLAATAFWAMENIAARRLLREGESSLLVSFGRMFFGSVFLFGVLGLTGNIGALLTITATQATNLVISTSLLLMYVTFYYASLRHINVSKAATILLLAPVVTLALGYRFLGEPADALQLAGSAAILAGAGLIAKVKSEFQTGV